MRPLKYQEKKRKKKEKLIILSLFCTLPNMLTTVNAFYINDFFPFNQKMTS